MTWTISKAILVAAGLSLLAGSPAFAARHDVNVEARQNRLLASTFRYEQPPLSARSGNFSAYIGSWTEGYPRSALR
jgi:hypothetical protein